MYNGATDSKTSRSYNTFGEITSETLETGITVAYNYDNTGRVQELNLPDGSNILYEHSAYLDSITRKDYVHTYSERDRSGLVTSMQLPGNAGILNKSHDLLGRNILISHQSFEQKSISFDAIGNLLTLHTKDLLATTNRTFTYDYLSQLTEEKGPINHSYSYDSLYNRLKKDGASYEVNSLHSVISDSSRTFTYDARGNRKEMHTKEGTTHYTYDALDRLIKITTPTETHTYRYDPFNRLLSKNNERYIYAFDNEIGAIDAQDNIYELRILGEGLGAEIGAAISLEIHGTTYIPIHDRQGNIATLIDLNGKPVETYRYDAFGNESTPDSPISPWRFSSKRVDPESGLINFGRRYYDPTLGKWLTPDPLGLNAGPNLYAYLLNSPMTRFDEYGLSARFEQDRHEIHYTAAYDMMRSREHNLPSRDTRDGPVRNDYPMYTWFSHDYVYTSNTPNELDEESEKGFWSWIGDCAWTVADWSLVAIDGISLATDAYAIPALVGGISTLNPLLIASSVTSKSLSLTGRFFVRIARPFIRAHTLDSEIKVVKHVSRSVSSSKYQSLDAFSRAGQVVDRNNLTKAGRALDKHGGRPGSAFPKAISDVNAKNLQGQFHLDDILTDPLGYSKKNTLGGIDFYRSDGAGARFYRDGSFRGFLEP